MVGRTSFLALSNLLEYPRSQIAARGRSDGVEYRRSLRQSGSFIRKIVPGLQP
eukprot:COSAG05_NODE_15113_length_378_cov_0.738351_1_plen_52_part_10